VKARRLRPARSWTSSSASTAVACGRWRVRRPGRCARSSWPCPGSARETADSIALYAAGLPLFVIDAYTRRVFSRLGLVRGDEPYDVLQRVFMEALPAEAALFNDYHAQVVMIAKDVLSKTTGLPELSAGRRMPQAGRVTIKRQQIKRLSPRFGCQEWPSHEAVLGCMNHGGAPVSTGTTTPADAGRACYRLVNPVGKVTTANDNLALAA